MTKKPDNYHSAKFDDGKPMLNLFFEAVPKAIIEINKTLEFGMQKGYARHSWRQVPDAEDRYKAAALRHALARYAGEECAADSKIKHLAHEIMNLLFVLQLELDSNKPTTDQKK